MANANNNAHLAMGIVQYILYSSLLIAFGQTGVQRHDGLNHH